MMNMHRVYIENNDFFKQLEVKHSLIEYSDNQLTVHFFFLFSMIQYTRTGVFKFTGYIKYTPSTSDTISLHSLASVIFG